MVSLGVGKSQTDEVSFRSARNLFDGHGWAHSIADGHLLRAAIKDILAVGPSYEVPSSTALGGSICERQHAADKDEDEESLSV